MRTIITDPKALAEMIEGTSNVLLRWGHDKLRHLSPSEIELIVSALRAYQPDDIHSEEAK